MSNTRTDAFLDLYRRLEAALRTRYELSEKESALVWAERHCSELRSLADELYCCRKLRNLLTHNPLVGGEYLAEPSEALLAVLQEALGRVEEPKLALQVGVQGAEVYTRGMDDLVRPALAAMRSQGYSHVPIVQDGVVEGMFSEGSLLALHTEHEHVAIDTTTTFSDIFEALPLYAHTRERFPFVARDTTLGFVADLFEAADARELRIGLVLVTEHGAQDERLLGIVSASDVAAAL